MPDIKYSHARRLYDSLLKYSDEQAASDIALNISLTKTPTEKKKIAWAQNICSLLSERFDDETVKKIRMSCSCNPSKADMSKIKHIYENSSSLSEFVQKYNISQNGHEMWEKDGTLYFSYPTCYCGCVKHSDVVLPKAWCYCSLGYTRKLFEYVLSCPVKVDLIESIKMGNVRCVMSIVRDDKP